MDLLYPAAMAHQETVALPEGTRYQDVSAAMELIYLDFPELFQVAENYTTHYYSHAPEIATGVTLTYRLTKQDADNLRRSALQQAGRLAARAAGSTADKLLMIHDSLCDVITYEDTGTLSHTIAGALLNGYAVCDGYANAFTLTARLCGIPCTTINGTGYSANSVGPHAWNAASVDGVFSYYDLTWDDADAEGRIMHWYVGLSLEQMQRDHTAASPDMDYRPSDDRHEYHRLHGITDLSRLQDAAWAFAQSGTPVEIRLTDREQYLAFPDTFSALLDDYNRAHLQAQFTGSYSILRSDEQLCCYVGR
ncbi:MAG: transglutaminase domain-containing protein [Clostridia bacterium]|nr:transglutaminase domain-containing protein [Clostridia bacterium]